MADFDFFAEFVAEPSADFCDDAETRNPGGFVNQDNLVFWAIHSLIISLTALSKIVMIKITKEGNT